MPAQKTEAALRPQAAIALLRGLYFILPLAAALSIAIAVVGVKIGAAILRHTPLSETELFELLLGVLIAAVCGVSGAAGAVGAARATTEFLKILSRHPAEFEVPALKLSQSDVPEVWDSVARVSQRLGVSPPANLILGFGAEVFVTDSVVRAYDAALTGRTLCLSAPLLRLLTVAEFESVVAHELAHFTGDDIILSQQFYPAYHRPARALREVRGMLAASKWHDVALVIPRLLVSRYLAWFVQEESEISRARELRADAMAADVCGPAVVVAALVKVHAYAPLYRGSYEYIVRWLKENSAFVNFPLWFVENAQRNIPALARSLREASPPHPCNGHPRFAERAAALGISVPAPQLSINGATAATLFSGLVSFEERLTELRTLEIMKTRPGHLFTKRLQPPAEFMTL